jgi:hypothetical protein
VNWKVILQLSLLGLAMGIATVFLIPSKVEPFFWLVVFIISAYVIATRCAGKHFIHGLLVGLANSIWVTGSHMLLFERYIVRHPQEEAMMSSMPMPGSPRLMMAIVGPVIGLISGALIGLFALIAARFVRSSAPTVPS